MSPVESQFHVSPFPPFPSAERYVRMGSQDDALQRVVRSVEAWEAISLVIGPPGTGKSLICRMLKNYFADTREVIVFGDAMLENPTSLQRHLLSRLDRIRGITPATTALSDDPQHAIVERIANSSKDFSGLLLLFDEAQDLSPETLETIRVLTNTMTSDGRPRVSAVLAGAPKLDETLALPSLEALVQRVATRCYVHPLSSDETVHYVREVLNRCGGWDESQVEESAIRSIHRACSGVPRLINQLMTASIEYAQSHGKKQLTGQTVDQAWAILQQLPSPIVDEPELKNPVSEVEFGPLCDEPETDCSETVCSEMAAVENDAVESECDTNTVDSCALHEQADGSVWEDATSPESIPATDDFDTIELEPTDRFEPVSGETQGACQMQLGIVSDESLISDASALESLSMDCQTIGNFDCDQSHVGQYQADTIASPLEQPVELAENTSPTSAEELFGEFDEEESVACASETIQFTQESDEESGRNDLESSLHREILSLRGAATAPVEWMDDCDGGVTINDDRDLLVIEDDIAVDGPSVSNEVEVDDSEAKMVAVDFQSMLAKMRSPGS